MSKVIINIDWAEKNFVASPEDEKVACIATGKTLEDVKRNIVDALRFHIEGMIEDGETIPKSFENEWTPSFKLTTRAQMRYSEFFITRKALARETGINEQQLSHYANGWKIPRPSTQRRITEGIRAISRHLAML